MQRTFNFKREDAKLHGKQLNKNASPLSSASKLLAKYKFYLDLKTAPTASKLELKIKQLGGNVEVFLGPEVTHFITDCEAYNVYKEAGSASYTSPRVLNESLSNNVLAPPHNGQGTRPKTRTEAMLAKACKQPNAIRDPIDQAKRWGITIWSVNKAFAWLEKLLVSVKTSAKKKSNEFYLKAPYIKFEAFDRKTKPIFQEIPNWPLLNFKGVLGEPAFTCRSPGQQTMTRKTRSNHHIDAAEQPGYCEICHVDYSHLDKHIESVKHQTFAKDDVNFFALDTLITKGSNIEHFLKKNGFIADEKTDSITLEDFNYTMMRTKLPRSCTIAASDRANRSPLSPTRSDCGHQLRSRRHTTIPNDFLNISIEDFNHSLPARELRSSARLSVVAKKSDEQDTWKSGRPKRSCIKQKRISADERLVVDNRTYYKVELMTNKLRSSGIPPKQHVPRKVKTPVSEDEAESDGEEEQGVVVKFSKLRMSELAVLNKEAEDFLFPRKDDSSSDDDVDGDGPNTTVSSKKANSSLLLSSEPERKSVKLKHDPEDESMDSNYSDVSMRKKRRRTQAEAFIMDNQKYYKFETPGSRLRYQGSYLSSVAGKVPKNNGEFDTKSPPKKEVQEGPLKEVIDPKEESRINLEQMQFSFERVPKSEPWYGTFQRQDLGQEHYTSVSESGYWKSLLLPYEMNRLHPLDPRICVSVYNHVKKHLSGTSSSSSASCSTPNSCGTTGASTPSVDTNTDGKLEASEEESKLADDCKKAEVQETPFIYRRRGPKRKGILMPGRNPRKSPRQHASTLAILSLLHQRKRKSRSPAKAAVKPNLSAIIEEGGKLVPQEPPPDYNAIAKEIDEMLSASLENLDELELAVDDNLNIELKYRMDAIEMLDYVQYEKTSKPTNTPTRTTTNTTLPIRKSVRKKKKKNRTGWPKIMKRIPRKGEAKYNKDEDLGLSELEDSIAGSLSVHADSEDSRESVSEFNINKNNQRASSVNNKINGDVQEPKLNGTNGNYKDQNSSDSDLSDDRVLGGSPGRKQHCGSSDDNCAEVVIASVGDRIDCVNVDLEKWENAEKVLGAKLTSSDSINNDVQFQPFVRVQKLERDIAVKHERKRSKSSSSPRRMNSKRPRGMPASPKSPRMLRKRKGKWYRERY